MTQYNFGTIDPYTKSGAALAVDLNSWRNALHTNHQGAAVPTYAVDGMQWLTNGPPWYMAMKQGLNQVPFYWVDPTTDQAAFRGPTLTRIPGAAMGDPITGDFWMDTAARSLNIQGLNGPIYPQHWETISAGTPATSSVVLTGLSGYRCLRLTCGITSATDNTPYIQVSIDGGSSWISGASDYEHIRYGSTKAFPTPVYTLFSSSVWAPLGAGATNADTQSTQFQAYFFEFNQGKHLGMLCRGTRILPTQDIYEHFTVAGRLVHPTARDAIRVYASAGSFSSINYQLEGWR